MTRLTYILLLFLVGCSIPPLPCDTTGLWEGQTIPYYLDERFEGTEQHELLLEAMGEFEALGFEFNRTYELEGDYIYIKWSGVAASYIGKKGGEQQMHLPVYWNTFYTATVHELGHAVGLEHTHKRSDRDEYLTIHWENIQDGNHSFFESSPHYHVGLDYYDIYSVMAYNCTYGSINGLPTMTLKNGSCFEPSDNLSEGDIQIIKNLYCL